MGFALPASIGIQLAKGPSQLVIMVAGDGGFDMTKSELSTLKDHNLPIKMFIINNGCLGMVR
jgi:acetolactate synthase-1/2/3 large subunit